MARVHGVLAGAWLAVVAVGACAPGEDPGGDVVSGEDAGVGAGSSSSSSGGNQEPPASSSSSSGGGEQPDASGPQQPTRCAEPPCANGESCVEANDCRSGVCTENLCWPASANDGVKNGDETDVDCGGLASAAPRCTDDKACRVGSDCRSLVCTEGTCRAPTASDGVMNGNETGVDCGSGPVSAGAPDTGAPACGDGQSCLAPSDCGSRVCSGQICRRPTASDGVKNGNETDVDCGSLPAAEGVVDTGAGVCAHGRVCAQASDCRSGVCNAERCSVPTANDGVKNGNETGVDCGSGPVPAGDVSTQAPVCAAGQGCLQSSDCDSRFCTAAVCEPRLPGRKDGDETDVDCGGVISPACDWDKTCNIDADCTSSACEAGRCLTGRSCKGTVYGGRTCGAGETSNGNGEGNPNANHESCCRSLPVPNFSDVRRPGSRVFLDKYEITGGRMRAFFAAMQARYGAPNVKGYIAENRPARWVDAWSDVLPASNAGPNFNYSITNPTLANKLYYPGNDRYASTQGTTWWIQSGDYAIDAGYFGVMGSRHFFPEFRSNPANWDGYTDYAASHNLNCGNGAGGYGYPTYWYDNATVQNYSGGVGKYFGQAMSDQRALNCTPYALFAAFCAWDGGELASSEVMDYLAGGNRFLQNGAEPQCGNGINAGSDGSNRCDGFSGRPYVYYYPADGGNDYDGSARVAPPGRVALDVVRINAGDEPWHDLKGNLVETVVKPDNFFGTRSYGHGWGSASHHRTQETLPRMKGGTYGARCMRFK